jgi:hypothetical protein
VAEPASWELLEYVKSLVIGITIAGGYRTDIGAGMIIMDDSDAPEDYDGIATVIDASVTSGVSGGTAHLNSTVDLSIEYSIPLGIAGVDNPKLEVHRARHDLIRALLVKGRDLPRFITSYLIRNYRRCRRRIHRTRQWRLVCRRSGHRAGRPDRTQVARFYLTEDPQMAQQPKVRQYSGDIRMWRKAPDGTLSPVIPDADDPLGNQPIEANANSFTYEAGDTVEIKSKQNGARYNQPIYSEQAPGTNGMTLQLLEMPLAILASVLRADLVNISVTAGSVTDDPVTVVDLVKPFQLDHRYILATPTPVVKIGVATLVAGTDYKLDRRRGLLTPVEGGALAAAITAAAGAGAAVLMSYTYPAVDASRFLGGALPSQKFYITGDMQDRISAEYGELEVFEANLGVDGEIDWLSAEPLQPTLTGPLLVPTGAPAPYVFTTYGLTA